MARLWTIRKSTAEPAAGVRPSDEGLVDAAREQAEALRLAEVEAPVRAMRLLPVTEPKMPWHLRMNADAVPRARGNAGPLLAVTALAAVLATGVGLRKSVVAAVPETAGLFAALGVPVNLRGLELKDVKSGVFTESSVELLVVQGEISNPTSKPKDVPPLLFTVRDAKGMPVYSWSASADIRTLEPGGKATFRRRLASPPAEGMDVLVRFAGKPEQLALAH